MRLESMLVALIALSLEAACASPTAEQSNIEVRSEVDINAGIVKLRAQLQNPDSRNICVLGFSLAPVAEGSPDIAPGFEPLEMVPEILLSSAIEIPANGSLSISKSYKILSTSETHVSYLGGTYEDQEILNKKILKEMLSGNYHSNLYVRMILCDNLTITERSEVGAFVFLRFSNRIDRGKQMEFERVLEKFNVIHPR